MVEVKPLIELSKDLQHQSSIQEVVQIHQKTFAIEIPQHLNSASLTFCWWGTFTIRYTVYFQDLVSHFKSCI